MTNPPIKDNQTCRLKEVRQQKGISLEMVHEATKVPLDALRSIEQGYSVHKLQTFYFRGFIKIYAKYLELDETQILQEYGMLESVAPKTNPAISKENKSAKAPVSSKVIAREPSRPVMSREMLNLRMGMIVRLIAVFIVLFFGFKWVAGFMSKNKRADKQNISQASAPRLVKPQTKNLSKVKSKQEVAVDTKKESQDKQQTVVAHSSTNNDANKEEVRADASAGEKVEKKLKVIELTVRATKNGWLQVKADGQIVFQSALKKGDSETWKADSEIELSGRNINLLEFELNGKMLGALGASDRGAKKVVFTKDGLSVKK